MSTKDKDKVAKKKSSSSKRSDADKKSKKSDKTDSKDKKKTSKDVKDKKKNPVEDHDEDPILQDDDGPILDDDGPILADDDDAVFLPDDDDAPILADDDDLIDEDNAPPMKIENPWSILSGEEFVEVILREIEEAVSAYVPFDKDRDGDETYQWKCLHFFRSLGWNFGSLDTVLDTPGGVPKICKNAGVLEQERAEKKKPKEIECSICADQIPFSESSALQCQHRFCGACYGAWISDKLHGLSYERLFSELVCPHKGCNLSILGPLVKKNCEQKDWEHYLRMLIKSFVSANQASYAICSSCGKVAKANYEAKTTSAVVNCNCGTRFCFKCGMAPHVPASCHDLEKWRAKDSDDAASLNFIKATTTECPKCGIALDRTTACNHITCKCSYQFCFVCKSKWGSCSTYSCSKFKGGEETSKKEFAPGYATASAWLVAHERYLAFSKKVLENKAMADKVETTIMSKMKKKSLDYRELKPGGNPQFIIEGTEILGRSYRIIQYTLVWGFSNIPPLICPQKQVFEMQIKNYEKMTADLLSALEKPVDVIDHLKTKALYTLLENNLIKQIESAEDLLSMFSEKKIGNLSSVSSLSRWICPKESCHYSNHPVEQATKCLLCGTQRPEVKISWFPDN